MNFSRDSLKDVSIGSLRVQIVDAEQACERLQPGSYAKLPYSLRVLAENIVRHETEPARRDAVLSNLLKRSRESDLPFRPARVVMQDLLGTPALVDLAGLRDAVAERGGDPQRVNPAIPVHMVVDHSLNVDHWASADAMDKNLAMEKKRNAERFEFFQWCNHAFDQLSIISSGNGILHQINLERLTPVVYSAVFDGKRIAFPDTLVGTDSHTPMINALGVFGWGVGGIEAEAAMLGKPLMFRLPDIVRINLTGKLRPGILATDLVLGLTQALRKAEVIGAFLEFNGPGLATLSLPDRATVANMAPEFGATMALFPIDQQTIDYLRTTARSPANCQLVESYAKAEGLWSDAFGTAEYDRTIVFDLNLVERAMAGPKHPHQRIVLENIASAPAAVSPAKTAPSEGQSTELPEGAVVIAAITACTNTSNPRAVIAAALLARNARRRGLAAKPWTKTSFAPGSRVVADYLAQAGLQADLNALGFQIVGFGCTTCCGMSGPLGHVSDQIQKQSVSTSAVLSGNRNFEGRIHPLVTEAFIMSPPLVVAYALAGSIKADIQNEVIGHDVQGTAVYLKDLWPSDAEIDAINQNVVTAELYANAYTSINDAFTPSGNHREKVKASYDWQNDSTYIRRPPYWAADTRLDAARDLTDMKPLAILGDHITTDHLSPSGAILPDSEAGLFLLRHGVAQDDFNSYGTRRGNHEVGMRSSFASPKLKNELVPGRTGSFTRLIPEGTEASIFAASQTYAQRKVPLIVIAGKEYGSGSSRDMAAKGPRLLGVRVVLAESFERIHRSNLAGMGILPLQFTRGETRVSLKLGAQDTFTVLNPEAMRTPNAQLKLRITRGDGASEDIPVLSRLDTDEETSYFQHGGLLPQLLEEYLHA